MAAITDQKHTKAEEVINNLIDKHESMRAFARTIGEDASDVLRWRYGRTPVKVRAVISICRLFPIKPSDLNPVFPADLEFVFKKSK